MDVMKHIVKEFRDDTFARARSESIVADPTWYWGLSDDNELFCKGAITGYVATNWTKFREMCMGGLLWVDIQRIVKTFAEMEVPCKCDMTVLWQKGCQCGSIKK